MPTSAGKKKEVKTESWQSASVKFKAWVKSLNEPFGGFPRCLFFFFNDTSTTEIYTLSLHDALPISRGCFTASSSWSTAAARLPRRKYARSEEHTSELQSLRHLVCRLLLEKKKK